MNFSFDPKWATIWTAITTVVAFLAATGLPPYVDPHTNDLVKQTAIWLAALFGAMGTVTAAFSSSATGPLVKPVEPPK